MQQNAKGMDEIYANESQMLRYKAYSALQGQAVSFGEELPIPEIIAIGGQSDGKSSLLEALLGFRFNVREVEMGTRRPLIVQMHHDDEAQTPICCLKNEHDDDFSDPIVPETQVAETVKHRTIEHLKSLGGVSVSKKPMVLKVRYAYCANLTIIDTPGFIIKAREQEPPELPEQIVAMVKDLASKPSRLILFLQQSSVEWASSLWLKVVQDIDPTLERTIVVASKFDNRLKEFNERWEVDQYLSATGYLPPSVKPFFVALPNERNAMTSDQWRHRIHQVDTQTLQYMREKISGGFNESQFLDRVGFKSLYRFLEKELWRRYRDATPAVLAELNRKLEEAKKEQKDLANRLHSSTDVATLRSAAFCHVHGVCTQVVALLEGGVRANPQRAGFTSAQEQAQAGCSKWPGVSEEVVPQDARLRLYGGAAFERCLREFQQATRHLKFPAGKTCHDSIANILLAQQGRIGSFTPATAAAVDLARQYAKDLLHPLLQTVIKRLTLILKIAFTIAADSFESQDENRQLMAPYVGFKAALTKAYHKFVSKIAVQAQAHVEHHLETCTNEYEVSAMANCLKYTNFDNIGSNGRGSGGQSGEGDLQENIRIQDTQLTVPETPSPEQQTSGLPGTGKRRALMPRNALDQLNARDQARDPKAQKTGLQQSQIDVFAQKNPQHLAVLRQSECLFNMIKDSIAEKLIPKTLRSAFLSPVRRQIYLDINCSLLALTDTQFMKYFAVESVIQALQAKHESCGKKIDAMGKSLTHFEEIARTM